MAGTLTRGLQILRVLVGRTDGAALSEIADAVGLPKSATHRILGELIDAGYVRQRDSLGSYMLTIRFVSMGIRHLAANGLVQLARPQLSKLADLSGALVRLSLVDDDRLIFVSQFQGARTGLRYDPENGEAVGLSSSASGHAWLAQLSDEQALEILFKQGIGSKSEHGPNAPETVEELRSILAATRERGYGSVEDSFEIGTSAIAAPVLGMGGQVVAVVSIAGPSALLTASKREELSKPLLDVTHQLSELDLHAHMSAAAS